MKTREIVIYGILSAVLLAAQVSLGFLPNIEIVTLLILVYTFVFRKKVFFIIYIFVFLEGLIYGFGLWWINANFPCFSYSNQKQEPKRPFFCRGSCNFIIISILKMQ